MLLFEMLAGQPPFDGEDEDELFTGMSDLLSDENEMNTEVVPTVVFQRSPSTTSPIRKASPRKLSPFAKHY